MWVFPVVLLFCVLVGLAGAAAAYYVYSPSRYSDGEIDSYVKSIYGGDWTLHRKQQTALEQEGVASYLYENKDGESFSVFSVSVPVEKDGLPTGRSKKALYDNYFSTVIENHLEEIKDLAKKVKKADGPELEIIETGEPSGAFGAQYIFRLYLENHHQIDEAASLIAQIDDMLHFSRKNGTAPWNQMLAKTPSVEVYLKPDRGITGGADAVTRAAKPGKDPDALKSLEIPVDWRSEDVLKGYKIGRIPFTGLDSAERIVADDLETRIENDYVDAARTFGKEHYSVSDELVEKYPAPVLTLVNVGGHDLRAQGNSTYTYQFIYHRKTGTYWMTGLDPCEDFDENPFGQYPRRGAFGKLVKWLGGSFTADAWSGIWRIGSTQWQALVQTKKTPGQPYAHDGLTLTCNGNLTFLDTVPEVFEGTGAVPSGRPYSIHDLIRMLDVRITINQKEMTAVMFRDFADQ